MSPTVANSQPQTQSNENAQGAPGALEKSRIEKLCEHIHLLSAEIFPRILIEASGIQDRELRSTLSDVVSIWNVKLSGLMGRAAEARRDTVLLQVSAAWWHDNRFPPASYPPGLDDTILRANRVLDVLTAIYLQPDKPLPAPSYFASSYTEWSWQEEQKRSNKVLCLRPAYPSRVGLPLGALHEVFRRYLVDVSSNEALPSPGDDEDAKGAQIAAGDLLERMGNGFWDRFERGRAFDHEVSPCFPVWAWDRRTLPGGRCANGPGAEVYAFFGFGTQCMTGQYPVILREDQNELGIDLDACMRSVRSYQLLVCSVLSNIERDVDSARALQVLYSGVPVFILCVIGPNLTVMGGFFDGQFYIVQPLGPMVSMLPDGPAEMENSRADALARVLYALRRGAKHLEEVRFSNPVAVFKAGIPRIYDSCRPFPSPESSEPRPLKLLSRISLHLYPSIFQATWVPPGRDREQRVAVKLIAKRYGVEVHAALASAGYAPALYAISQYASAPAAYVMEYLSSNWVNLCELKAWNSEAFHASKQATRNALHRIITFLESQQLVHGDIEAENVMIRVGGQLRPCISPDNIATLQLVNFHWAGKGGTVFYPGCSIRAPRVVGGPAEPIEVGHDRILVDEWFDDFYSI